MAETNKLVIGCVADDFTGAGDAASFLAANGIRTVLTNGCPTADAQYATDFQAIVIALKSRTQETAAAVTDALEAFDWLRARGAQTLYFKYCSTFDSTPQGNIGPVIDAVLERYNLPYTILCPALLVNKRSVREGVLYVDGVPLAQSHMKNHPLTPMWASDLVELMRPQGRYPCYKVTAAELSHPEQIATRVHAYSKEQEHFYLAVDYAEEQHGSQILHAFKDLPFLTGGSGLLGDFGQWMPPGSDSPPALHPATEKQARLIVAGSCSVATRGQVQRFLECGGKGIMVSPAGLAAGTQSIDSLWDEVQAHRAHDLLVYSAGSGGCIEQAGEADAGLLEQVLSTLARRAVESGCTRLIAAGGETSGAVTQALGYDSFYIGETVAPGVPIMVPTGHTNLQMVLKSGNFGGPDFFLTTLLEGI